MADYKEAYMDDITVPIYLITGFLESGKTQFLRFTLDQEYFQIDGKTLLILCEEGEEEYDLTALAKRNIVVEVIEKEDDFTKERLEAMEILHQPERVVIEYNGMWLATKFEEEMDLPQGWGIDQHITCVDGSTFQTYMTNMKSLFMDMIKHADMIVFNRCKKEDPLANYRRSIKVVNPGAEIIFEDENGEIDIFEDQLPFDINAPVVCIPPEDYGIWYVDSSDHPENYVGKTVRFKVRARKAIGMSSKFFAAGRMAMTCCADDVTFLGYICKSAYAPKLTDKQWIDLTAKVALERRAEYRGEEGIVLYAENITECDPLPDEMVYFN